MVTPDRNGTPEQRSAYFRELQKKSRQNYKGTGGFAALKQTNPDKLREVSQKAGQRSGEARRNLKQENDERAEQL